MVRPVEKSRSAASATETRLLVPLKASAFPFFPAVVHVAPASDPMWPFPVASVVVVPLPSLNA
jgi:hypothetical protein